MILGFHTAFSFIWSDEIYPFGSSSRKDSLQPESTKATNAEQAAILYITYSNDFIDRTET